MHDLDYVEDATDLNSISCTVSVSSQQLETTSKM